MKNTLYFVLSALLLFGLTSCSKTSANIAESSSEYTNIELSETKNMSEETSDTEETYINNEDKNINSDIDLRPQKNGYYDNDYYYIESGNYIIPIPDYWSLEEVNDDSFNYKGYAETGGKIAMIMITSHTDKTDPVTFDTLYNDRQNLMDLYLNDTQQFGISEFINSDIYESTETKGIIFKYKYVLTSDNDLGISMDNINQEELDGIFMSYVFPSTEDGKWIYIQFNASDNTEYRYDNDFYEILKNIKKKNKVKSSNTLKGVRPEFKEAMDSYESFFDEYCEIMKKYNENPDDMSLLMDYLDFMTEYDEIMTEMDDLNTDDLTNEEQKYYLEVQSRITSKLLAVS